MNSPLIGTRENNYKFFYCVGISGISSLLILLIITGYTAYISTDIGRLMRDMSEVIEDVRIILPTVEESFRMLHRMCVHENFTKSYGNVCYEEIQ